MTVASALQHNAGTPLVVAVFATVYLGMILGDRLAAPCAHRVPVTVLTLALSAAWLAWRA